MSGGDDAEVLEIAKDIQRMLKDNKPSKEIESRIEDLRPYSE